MAFPSSPTNNQVAVINGISYTYNSTLGAWVKTSVNTGSAVAIAANVITVANTLTVASSTTLAALSATTGSFSSTLGVTGAATLSSTLAVTGLITSTGGISGGSATHTTGSFSSTLGVSGATTLAALSATTGSFSSTLGVTGALTGSSGAFSGSLQGAYIGVNNTNSTTGYGLSLYGGATAGQPTYGIMFQGTGTFGTYGTVSADWATYFTMDSTANRGWIFRDTTNGNKASISNLGDLNLARSLGVGTSASGTAGQILATNSITAYYSDKRLKTEIGKIENALDKIDQLCGVIYTQNKLAEDFGYNNYEEQIGLYAQDVNKVQPQAVKPAPFDVAEDGSSKSGENYLTVQYEKLVPLLVEGIKELRAEIKKLKGE